MKSLDTAADEGTVATRRRWSRCALIAVIGGLAACGGRPDSGAAVRFVAEFGGAGTGPGRFGYPRAIDCDATSVWVIDKTARVQRLDPVTGDVRAAWTMPEYRLGKPTGVTVAPGPDGRDALYVPDTHYQRVLVYAIPGARTADGAPPLMAEWGTYGTGPGEFIYPTDVAVLPNAAGAVDRVYVSEYGGNDRVSVFDPEHRFLFSFGRFGTPGAALVGVVGRDSADAAPASGDEVVFNRPQSVALDAARKLMVVADACNHRLGVFDLEGRVVRWIGSRETVGRGPGRFNYPYGLALCGDGSVLVSEFGNHRVQRIDPRTGESLGVYLAMGRGEGRVTMPWGVAVARDGGTAYVLDSGNNRVVAFGLPAADRLAARGGAR